MQNVTKLSVAEDHDAPDDTTVSIFDVIAETNEEDKEASLEVLRIGTDVNFVSFFTDHLKPVSAHYLEATETWAGTYAKCLGDDCPACKAGLTPTEYFLMPVIDRLEGRVKVLRITRQKGPGKLLTELGQVLALPDRDKLIVRITRNNQYIHKLEIESERDLDPDLVRVMSEFTARVNAGALNVEDVIPSFSECEMSTHEQIAKRLALVSQS